MQLTGPPEVTDQTAASAIAPSPIGRCARAAARGALAATAAVALSLPLASVALVSAQTTALADRLAARSGTPARIGGVDADLTGTIRLTDVALGHLIAAEVIEASVALDSLLAGTLRADEIRVAGPRVAIEVDADGDSDLSRVARQLLGHRVATRAGPGRLRRIVVSAGTLSAKLAGIGELRAEAVELVPDAGGVRVITGRVRLDGRAGALGVSLGFARSAVEVSLPNLRFGRMLAVGGTGVITGAHDARARLGELAIGRIAVGGPLELRATVDAAGIPRALAIDVAPHAQAIAIRGDRIPLAALAGLAPHGLALRDAHATGSVAIRRDAARLVIELAGSVTGVTVDHRALAAVPVPLAGSLRAELAVSPETIAVSRAELELGAAHWSASGWLRRGAPLSGQVDLTLAPAACGDLLAALPAALRGPLDGLVLAGSFGGHVRLGADLAAPPGDGLSLVTSIADDCRAEAEPPAADVTRLVGVSDQAFADGSRARVGGGEPGWTALRPLPAHVPAAFVSAEDARFYDHAGFDLTQIARSLEIDLRERRLARGGSTISQQLVKNAFLLPRRSFDRKLQEAILTWRLEARLTKRQILERYLNIIELGPRVFGLAAAARHWFDATPRELTVRQAAFLAALTSEPTSMSRRVRRAGGLDPDSAARLDIVLRAMRRDGALTTDQLDVARAAPLQFAAAALTQER
jgi:Transglycosylase